MPAAAAISSTVVSSKPRSANTSSAAFSMSSTDVRVDDFVIVLHAPWPTFLPPRPRSGSVGGTQCHTAEEHALTTTAAGFTRYTGARVPRVEDERLLRGEGTYVDDIVRPGMLHA